MRNYVSGGHKLVLAARLSGEAKSAFPNGAPKPAPADDKKTADKDAKKTDDKKEPASPTPPGPAAEKAAKADHVTSGKINVIVVADTDLLADQFWVNRRELAGQDVIMPTAHNAAFVVGALENLSGSNALIGLRGRGVKDRPFTLVEDLRRSAEQKFRAKEEALEEKLKSAQSELQKIQTSSAGSAVLSEKEQEAVGKFRAEMLNARRELRNVKHALRQNIDDLGGWLKFANIAFVPLMLGAAAFGLSWRRSVSAIRSRKTIAEEEVR